MLLKKRRMAFLMFFSLFCLFFSLNCKGSDTKPVTIKVSFWGDNKEIAIIKSIIEPWAKKRKDIKVVLEHIPGQYMTKLQTEFAGGVGPDVVFCEVNNFVELYFRDVLIPLNPFIASDTNFRIGQYYPEIINRFTRDKKIYIIPRDIAPFACVYYNKALFDLAGIPYPKNNWTTEDLVRIGQALTITKNNITVQFGFFNWFWWNWLYTFGGGFVDNSTNPTKLTLSSHLSRAGLQFYHDLMWKYKISPTPSISDSGSQLFITGRLAMYCSGIWESPAFNDIQSFDWDVVISPQTPNGRRGFGSGGSGYGISKSCKHPEKAWEVIKCLADLEGQIKMAKSGLAQPAIMNLAQGKYFNKNGKRPFNKGMLDKAVNYVNFDPFHKKWPNFYTTVIQTELDPYFRNKITLDEALKRIDIEFGKQGIFNME